MFSPENLLILSISLLVTTQWLFVSPQNEHNFLEKKTRLSRSFPLLQRFGRYHCESYM